MICVGKSARPLAGRTNSSQFIVYYLRLTLAIYVDDLNYTGKDILKKPDGGKDSTLPPSGFLGCGNGGPIL